MLSKQELREKYRKYDMYPVTSRGDFYLSFEKTLMLVEECEQNNLAILGSEGFEIHDDGIHPRIDMIADFSPKKDRLHPSWDAYKNSTYKVIKEFLAHCSKESDHIGFCLVLMTETEYKRVVEKFLNYKSL